MTASDDPAGPAALPDGFDPGFYLLANPDVAESGADPAAHWLAHGHAEGRAAVGPRLLHPDVYEVRDRLEFLWKAFRLLAFNGVEGDYLEFGCGVGTTLTAAWRASQANRPARHLWGFDSFHGLPAPESPLDDHPQWVEGRYAVTIADFERRCRLNGVPEDAYTLVPGFYKESLAAASGLPGQAALAYIDCDLYSSTADVLAFLGTRLGHGSVVAFDDWFCWSPSGVSGEMAAQEEFCRLWPQWRFHPYLPFGWHGQSFLVQRMPE